VPTGKAVSTRTVTDPTHRTKSVVVQLNAAETSVTSPEGTNVAVTAVFALMVKTQSSAPEHAPLHPWKAEPD